MKKKKELHEHASYGNLKGATQRILLWLGLANGAGLGLAAGRALDSDKTDQIALLLPSCWFFAAGIVMVGLAEVVRRERFRLVWLDDILEENSRGAASNTLKKFEDFLGIGSSVAFAAGLFVPLIQLSSSYPLVWSLH